MAGEEPPLPPQGDAPDLADLLVEGVRQLLDASPEAATTWRSSAQRLFRNWERWLPLARRVPK